MGYATSYGLDKEGLVSAETDGLFGLTNEEFVSPETDLLVAPLIIYVQGEPYLKSTR